MNGEMESAVADGLETSLVVANVWIYARTPWQMPNMRKFASNLI